MKQTNFLIILTLLITSCISTPKISDEVFKKKLSIFNEYYKDVDKSNISILFREQKFNLKWSNYTKGTLTLEFIKPDETLSRFSKIITYVSPTPKISFKEYLESYLALIKKYQITDPKIFSSSKTIYKKDLIIDVLLVDKNADRFEHVLSRVFVDQNDLTYSITYSTVYKFSVIRENRELSKDIGNNRGKWIVNLANINFNYNNPFDTASN